jgi:hypothetical protein
MKRSLFIVMLFTCLAILLVACNDQNQGTGPSKQSSGQEQQTNAITTPVPAPTFPKSAVSSIPTAITYYQALKDRDYAKAYAYLDANATTTDGKKLTQESFTQMAQNAFTQSGAITDITMVPGSSDGTQIVTTIDRNAGVHYHSHLTMKKEGSTWKILSLDRI